MSIDAAAIPITSSRKRTLEATIPRKSDGPGSSRTGLRGLPALFELFRGVGVVIFVVIVPFVVVVFIVLVAVAHAI
jgi:hypothetical protein